MMQSVHPLDFDLAELTAQVDHSQGPPQAPERLQEAAAPFGHLSATWPRCAALQHPPIGLATWLTGRSFQAFTESDRAP